MSEADAAQIGLMLEGLRRIALYIEGRTLETFLDDQRTIDAIALNLLVVGEASIKLSSELKRQMSADWPAIAGLRHRIAHHYYRLAADRMWLTASQAAPELNALVRSWMDR